MSRRNPNGYGSVTRLKGHRARPYVVRVSVYDEHGNARQKAVGYAETKEKAMLLLAQYHESPWEVNRDTITFNELYQKWLEVKAPNLGESNQKKLRVAYRWCSPIYGMKYRMIKSYHMQKCINECPRGYQSKAAIQVLFKHLDEFAFEMDIINKMYSQLVVINESVPASTRKPFSEGEIDLLWKHSDSRNVQIILIYLYTGFRINELLQMKTEQVDLKERTFTGGEKTAAGKNRVVPIHHRILPFVENFVNDGQEYFLHTEDGSRYKLSRFYTKVWDDTMKYVRITGKTTHSCRHTFETRLDNAGANRKCIDMLMGHTSKDIGNRIYNHKTLGQLRETIELLR